MESIQNTSHTFAPERSTYWDAIRGMSVLRIVLVHTGIIVGWHPFIENFHIYLLPAMEMIIFLSGFLICQKTYQLVIENRLGTSQVMKRFALRRVIRIVPFYYLFIFLCFLFPSFAGFEVRKGFIQFLTFTMNNHDLHYSGLSHMWTLCIEMTCYFLFLWMIPFLAQKKIYLIFATLVLISFFARLNVLTEFGALTHDEYFSKLWAPTFFHWDSFWIGAAFGLVYYRGFKLTSAMKVGLLLFGVFLLGLHVFLVGILGDHFTVFRQLMSPLWGSLFTACLILGIDVVPSQFIKKTYLHTIGKMSFSMYLIHKSVLFNVIQFTRSHSLLPPKSWIELGVSYGALIFATYLVFNLIEQPLLNYLQDVARARSQKKSGLLA